MSTTASTESEDDQGSGPESPPNPSNEYECSHPGCARSFKAPGDLSRHVKQVHEKHADKKSRPDKSHKCAFPGCDYTSATARGIRNHFTKSHVAKNFQCTICPKKFADDPNRIRHEKQHKANPHMCSMCHSLFKSSDDLEKHVDKKHGMGERNKDYACDYPNCGKRFESIMALRNHKHKHKEEKAFKCDLCGFPFGTEYLLQRHMKEHKLGDDAFECRKCKRRFMTEEQRDEHEKEHDQPHKCTWCTQAFSTAELLAIHKGQKHEKKQKCPTCHKAFWFPSWLAEHMKSHDVDKTYSTAARERAKEKLEKLWHVLQSIPSSSSHSTPTTVEQVIIGKNLQRWHVAQMTEPLANMVQSSSTSAADSLRALLQEPRRREITLRLELDEDTNRALTMHLAESCLDTDHYANDSNYREAIEYNLNVEGFQLNENTAVIVGTYVRSLLERYPTTPTQLSVSTLRWLLFAARVLALPDLSSLQIHLQSPVLRNLVQADGHKLFCNFTVHGFDKMKAVHWTRTFGVAVGAVARDVSIEIQHESSFAWVKEIEDDPITGHRYQKIELFSSPTYGYEACSRLSRLHRLSVQLC
jgi:uncharacterized C2H2 Zn-finger protein